MQNDLNPPSKRRTALVLAMGLIATLLVGVLATTNRNSTAQRGSIQGAGDSVDTCSLLGIDYGDKPGTVIGTQGSHAEYFTYDMGVSSTMVDLNTPMGEIEGGIRAAGTDIHMLRFGNDYGSVDAVAAKIEQIMNEVNAPSTVYIMPTNEPGSELRRYYYGEKWTSSPDATPEQIADWLDELIGKLKASSNPEVRDTSAYLIFPAINIEKPSGPTYVSGELETKGIAQNLNDPSAFHGFAVSVQHTSAGSDFSGEINKYKAALGSAYNGNLIMYGVAGGAKGFDEGAYESFQRALETFRSELSGVYFFSPWGWSDPQGIAPTNPPFDLDIWDRLFTECGRRDNKCGLTDYADLPGLKSCQRIENDDIRSSVPVRRLAAPVDDKEFEAHVVVTQKVTAFGLLKWLSSSNYAQDSAPINGTSANPYVPPCAVDLQVSNDDPFGFVDMSNIFRGPILLKNSDDEFEYQMPELGNAVACLVWRLNNYQPGSKTPTQLAKGFRSESPSAPRVSNKQFEEILAEFEAPSKIPDQNGPYCGGVVDRTEESDKVSGEEIIIRDDILVLSRVEMCERIMDGTINVGRTEADKKRACPPTAANPNGVYRGDSLGMSAYVPVESKTTDQVEIPGLLEGLKQLYIEEAIGFPWQARYKVIHKDKAGIRISSQKRLYDGLTRKTKGASYSSPLTSGGSPSCEVRKYDGGLKAPSADGGKVSGRADHIFPFVGQTPKMMARITRTFSRVTNDDYIQTKKRELREAESRYKQAQNPEAREEALDGIITLVTKQDDLFVCKDLDELAASVDNDELSEIIAHTDCMGAKTDTDPFASWLCSQEGVFTPGEKAIYCQGLQCLAPTDYENAIELKLEEVKGELAFPIVGQYTQTGTYSPAHPGLDLGAGKGTTVVATTEGTVIYARNEYDGPSDDDWINDANLQVHPIPYWADYGNLVVIDHGDFYSIYAHLDYNTIKVTVGQSVTTGQVIGGVGSTGKSDGNHLHFELRLESNGEICADYDSPSCTVDPSEYLSTESVSPTSPSVNTGEDVKLCKADVANIKYDNLCQLLERHEEVTGIPRYLTAAILMAESSAKSDIIPGRPFFSGDPYEVSHVNLNKDCRNRLASPTAIGCDCRGPGGWCVTGMHTIESGICEGINTWYQYGVPDESEFDVSTMPIDYDENGNWRGGQCIKNGKVTFGVGDTGRQGDNYAETIECVQGLGMDIQYGELLNRTRVGDTICAIASRANRSPGTWDEQRIRDFSVAYYGEAGFYDNKIWRLYNEYKDQWDNSCVMFSNN